PARDWNWADDYLRDERGFSFAEDHRALSEAERATTELVGIDGAGLMHLKTRLFETPAERTLVTGSMNPGDDAVSNDETWHLIRDERIFDRYADLYDAVSYERPIVNEWVDGAGLNVLSNPESSGPDAGARLLGWLQEEDEQILIMAFSLRDLTAPGVSGSLVSILGEKVAAGVPVVVITDRNQSDGTYDGTEDKLRAVGAHVYEARNYATEFTAMHHKVAVLGRTDLRVITDAANWSKAGLGSTTKPADNVESTLFVEPGYDGGKLGQRYLAQFVRVLGRYAEQSAAEGEPSFDELGPELMGLPGWPEHEVTFVAEEAYTSWGETVRVTGDLPELGAWGATGLGHPLWTEPSSYPTWSSPEPLRLPVGATFEYKLVAERDGVFRWEAGDNHVGFAQPPAFAEGLGSTQVNLWR
ncbi:MAG: carbohydrate-binding module family 20 domain-containing protein, partial [Myxococcota bacterium]